MPPKPSRTRVAPGVLSLDSRSQAAVTDPIGSRQATILQVATPFNDGIMSAEQAAIINNIPVPIPPVPPGDLVHFTILTRPTAVAFGPWRVGFNDTTNELNVTNGDGVSWFDALGNLA
jgi:hypothetical protein